MNKILRKIIFVSFLIYSVCLISCTEDEQIVISLTFDSETFYANKAKQESVKPLDYEFSYIFKDAGNGGQEILIKSSVKNETRIDPKNVDGDIEPLITKNN